MKYRKRWISALLAAGLICTLVACGQQGSQPSAVETPTQAAAESGANAAPETSETVVQTIQVSEEPETGERSPAEQDDISGEETAANVEQPAEEQTSRVLVVYFSASGNTETVAGCIAEATGGDLFELEPVEGYSEADLDWTDSGSRVNAEHDDPALRDIELVADTVENWDEYDTVFIGYPIWWGIAAWPVNGFVEANDFSGKTVIPFCTSSSSGLGESGELLAEAAGTGTWLEGQRFRSGVDQNTVVEWIDSLEL